ncbi:MAG: Glutamate racemase [Elusimicrobia bacterium ADurb.Bin231]|nr:MAG: Glutamate racemase [Elusimicrobia bacterium ADurb.Bin231]
MKKNLCDKPIGVFDSGMGGLTVVKELLGTIPCENIIYFGDTARVPYGTKSKESVIRFSNEIVDFLLQKKVKLILVACNTASAVALVSIRKKTDVPVMGVIESGAAAAAAMTRNGKIGVIGTTATINSGAYKKEIKSLDRNIKVIEQACPLFVPLVEEGWISQKITRDVAEKYLSKVKYSGADTIILGCTHYPLIKKVIADALGNKIRVVDSATEIAKKVKDILKERNILNETGKQGYRKFYVSDAPEKFKRLGRLFLGRTVSSVFRINVEK